ncbi:hypothetical protein GUITHDRAFT_135739 [Guillardia theta CCMP2712]|uniref:Ribosome biogenesis protein NOP53 n=1 Tax=Guillardia theta (strain CCMP2712) TaxID=905079 RepID=L1JNN7_GUITC|nr:hypothetical protein GUITHDRAFT_135739 [Guillardia theta CCMP2712]EKX50077.1 hypothetical protein GUITHDRAFT_135739 [Guillardia theta CCMP2712]|eukprot:XP_005837057.1 hypothetical protein GUITHDRAFT_135739 [Guillardia theta CCMP2712]
MLSVGSCSLKNLGRLTVLLTWCAVSVSPCWNLAASHRSMCIRLRGGEKVTSLKRMRPHEKRVKSDRAKKMQKVIRKKHQVTQMKQQPKLERPVIAEPEDLMDYDAYMDDVRQLLEPVLTNTPEKRIMKRMEGLRAKGFKPGEYVARHNIKTTEAPTRGKHIRFEDSKPKKTRQDKKTKAELRREKRHKKKQKKKEDKMKKRKVKALAKQKLKLKEANFRSKFDLMKSIIEKLQMELKDQAPLAENEIPVVMQAIERGDWKSTSMTPLQRRIAGIIQSVISKQPKLKDEIAEDTSEELKEDSLSLEYIPGPHRRALEPDEISNEISDLSKSEVEEKEEEPQIRAPIRQNLPKANGSMEKRHVYRSQCRSKTKT